jgi:hypothetical protein
MSLYDKDDKEYNKCKYCESKSTEGYCEYRDNVVVPRKQAMIKRIIQLRCEEKLNIDIVYPKKSKKSQ